MFIDDNEGTNFYHEIIMDELDISHLNSYYLKAGDALDYISELNEESSNQMPEIIFLDINMPRIDAWKFIELFKQLNINITPDIILVTTSLNPLDEEKAKKEDLIKGLITKPLDKAKLHKVFTGYWERRA